MKDSLALTAAPLLLLLFLGTASTLPLVDLDTQLDSQDLTRDSQNEGLDHEVLSVDPRATFIPVIFGLDPYLSTKLKEESIRGALLEEGAHRRNKRQSILSGDIGRSILSNGVRQDSGSINLDHTFGRHTFTGGLSGQENSIPGLSSTTLGANGAYQFRPNSNTAFSLAGSHSNTDGSLRQTTGQFNFDRALGPHSLGGSLNVARTSITGLGSSTDLGVNGRYQFSPSSNTLFSAEGGRTWSDGGSMIQDSGSLNLRHNIGRHGITGGVSAQRTTFPGLGVSSSSTAVNGGYDYQLNQNNILSLRGSHSSSGGNSIFLNLRRRF